MINPMHPAIEAANTRAPSQTTGCEGQEPRCGNQEPRRGSQEPLRDGSPGGSLRTVRQVMDIAGQQVDVGGGQA